jgi:DUF2950 family protein
MMMIGHSIFRRSRSALRHFLVCTVWAMGVCMLATVASAQQVYKTPEDAAASLADAVKTGSKEGILRVLGPDGEDIVSSGDDVADAAARQKFLAAYDAKHAVTLQGDGKAVMILGAEDYPFPIPLVRKRDDWTFDTQAGRQEILYRRIGRNELDAIEICLAYVDAQNEYAEKDRTGAGAGIYAQRIVSNSGKKDGLYWPDDGDTSPLGELAARASTEGYNTGPDPAPFHGYYFRILTRQGAHAAGGAFSYVVKGKMIGGFALVAYPAEYGNSGVMTFVVNHKGDVFQKDLGPRTDALAKQMMSFDPDQTWKKVDPPGPMK